MKEERENMMLYIGTIDVGPTCGAYTYLISPIVVAMGAPPDAERPSTDLQGERESDNVQGDLHTQLFNDFFHEGRKKYFLSHVRTSRMLV